MSAPPELEPERYELIDGPLHAFPLGRRAFFKLLGGGIAVVSLVEGAAAQESGGRRRGREGAPPAGAVADLGAWLHVGEDGTITAFTGKAEVGQDIRTALTQVIVEELPAPLPTVRLVMGDTALTPFDAGTFGSRTTPAMAPQLRRVAASARELLLDRAAAELKVPRAELTVNEGEIVHAASGRGVRYGVLTRGEKLLAKVAESPPVTPPDRWRVAGQRLTKLDGRAVVTGSQKYVSDLVRPGLLRGKVLRPPRFGAKLEALDTRGVRAIRGARAVRDGDFVGVTAPDEATADRALKALRPTWKLPEQDAGSDQDVHDRFRRAPGERRAADTQGDVDAVWKSAAHRLESSYTAPYIAHVPLEPRAAVAEWTGDALTVWTGTQRPFGVRRELADAFRVGEDKIRVIAADTGSGYGGKHTGEAAVEAARLAKDARRPVKVVWSREEEMTWAYFRPAGLVDVRGAVAADGKLLAWEMTTFNAGGSGLRTPYAVANQRHLFQPVPSPLRQGSYRALAATVNNFAREAHMDALAALAKVDPLAFREKNLTDPRLLGVLRAAAARFGWGKAPPTSGAGFGLACGVEKGGWVASCVEVRLDAERRAPRVTRVVTAFDCGAVINADIVENQVEGAILMGLGGALTEAIQFRDGRVLNPRLSAYRVPRFADTPALETILVDGKDTPSSGAGEAPIITIAPAIANALFAITGKRHRALPLTA